METVGEIMIISVVLLTMALFISLIWNVSFYFYHKRFNKIVKKWENERGETLALATSRELVHELMTRPDFQAVIIQKLSTKFANSRDNQQSGHAFFWSKSMAPNDLGVAVNCLGYWLQEQFFSNGN